MKTYSLIQKPIQIVRDHQLKVAGLLVLFIVAAIILKLSRFKKDKLNQFLHSLGFTETDHKTGEIIYPKVIIKKEKIIIRKSNKISKRTVEDNKSSFEKFFRASILDIEDYKGETIIYIVR